MRTSLLTIAATAAAFAALPSQAAVITFSGIGGSNGDPYSTYTESGFTFKNTSGGAFKGQVYGSPVPSVVIGTVFGGTPTATFELTGPAQFTFGGFDYSANGGPGVYSLVGLLGNTVVFNYAGVQTTPINAFAPISGAAGLVDKVLFTLVATGSSANIDNISANGPVVPEPATWALVILGFGAIGGVMRRRRLTVRYAA